MFGFGLFSTHLPYLVLLIGYAACWFWNAQNTEGAVTGSDDLQPARASVVSPVSGTCAGGEGHTTLSFVLDNAPLAGLPADASVFFYMEKERHYPLPPLCGTIRQEHKRALFLRPPPIA